MTHSNHRQGTCANLANDFVIVARPWDSRNAEATLERYREIGFRHQPVNVPGVRSAMSPGHLVYDSREKLAGFLRDIAPADLGVSITVSGLFDQVEECCRAAGLSPYVVNLSLGFWGNTVRLADRDILEITSMCGHGRVAPGMVRDLAGQVRQGRTACGQAARKMGKLCLCNIFNEVRAAGLLEEIVARGGVAPAEASAARAGEVPRKDYGITIDEEKCSNCGECLPICPVAAIVEVEARNTVVIDARRCTECGVCWQSKVCPVDAIVAGDLRWPRTLRGKFQNPHAPYRAAPLMAPVSSPGEPGGRGQAAPGARQFPGELSDDHRKLLQPGETVIVIEPGRPHVGATFGDVQKIVQALLPAGLRLDLQYPPLEERTPLTELAVDPAGGVFRQDILEERAGWVVLKLLVPGGQRPAALETLHRAAAQSDTVFAVNLVCRVEERVSALIDRIAAETGFRPAANGKTNVGLGCR
ncbi:MAG: 4Fe-4S binding protein [Chloroflexi bacterium]|nr:4Fe-4S binding protein [Chloroflexota bacterium]